MAQYSVADAAQALVGWRGYAAAALAGALVAGAAAWTVQGWRGEARLARQQAQTARDDAEVARAALAQTTRDIQVMATAAAQAAGVAPQVTAAMSKLNQELKNATPLPAGCRPDGVRLRTLQDAVGAANRAAAGQSAR